MTLRFQADVNLNQLILRAACRREPALDFQTAETAGLAGLPDPEVLAHAKEDSRILITHDLQTMPRHSVMMRLSILRCRTAAAADEARGAMGDCCNVSAVLVRQIDLRLTRLAEEF